MKMCQPHWDKIIAAVKDRNMWSLVSANAETAVENIKADIEGDAAAFDPLLACNFMVMNRALEMGGLYLMGGDYCPICEAMKHQDGLKDEKGETWDAARIETHWIDGPANLAMSIARDKGLLPKEQ
jgi:hypothetical protein